MTMHRGRPARGSHPHDRVLRARPLLEQFAIRPDSGVICAFRAPLGFHFARVISF